MGGFLLLLGLFKNYVLSKHFGVLFELDLAGYELLVFARPIHLSGGGVLEDYKFVLRHSPITLPKGGIFGNYWIISKEVPSHVATFVPSL